VAGWETSITLNQESPSGTVSRWRGRAFELERQNRCLGIHLIRAAEVQTLPVFASVHTNRDDLRCANHFMQLSMMTGYTKSKDIPAPALAVGASAIVILLGGLSLILGYHPTIGAALLVMLLLAVSFLRSDRLCRLIGKRCKRCPGRQGLWAEGVDQPARTRR